MKRKVVVKLSMNGEKTRSKALKISLGISGVESAKLTGQWKDQVEVVGEGIDAVELARQLRKNVAYAELVSVSGRMGYYLSLVRMGYLSLVRLMSA